MRRRYLGNKSYGLGNRCTVIDIELEDHRPWLCGAICGIMTRLGVVAAAALVMLAASTGNFRRFERFALMLVLGSFLVFPVLLFIHPPAGQMIQDMMVPKMPHGAALNEVMLLIMGGGASCLRDRLPGWSTPTFDYQFIANPAYNADRGP